MSLLDLIPGGRIGLALGVAAVVAAVYAGHLLDVERHEERAFAAGKAEVQSKWDRAEKIRDETAAKAEAAARAEEQRRTAAQMENERANEKRLSLARADAAAAVAAQSRLQQRVAELAARAGSGRPAFDPTSVEQCTAAGTAVDLLADVQRRIDEAAGQLAVEADKRGAAGLKCQSDYDSLSGDSTSTPEAVSR